MTKDKIPQWLTWAREIQAIAQTGKHYAMNDFQTGRYDRLAEIAAEITVGYSALDEEDLGEKFKLQPGYATPKVDLRAAVFNEAGEILLVREVLDDGWTLPGGWADVGEAPSEGAEREVLEEAGFEVKAMKLIGVYDANRIGELKFMHAYKLVFLCELVGGEAAVRSETS